MGPSLPRQMKSRASYSEQKQKQTTAINVPVASDRATLFYTTCKPMQDKWNSVSRYSVWTRKLGGGAATCWRSVVTKPKALLALM